MREQLDGTHSRKQNVCDPKLRPHKLKRLSRIVEFFIQFFNKLTVSDSVKWFRSMESDKNTAHIKVGAILSGLRAGD